MLLDAGSDLTTRDNNGNNLIHGLLQRLPMDVKPDDHKTMQKMLELLNPALRQEMMLDRNSYNSGAYTPLHNWLRKDINQHANCENEKNCMGAMMLRTLLSHSNSEELYMVDGSGDTPVHDVVQAQNLNYLKIMLEAYPSCIWRENAVGRTPAELAMSVWLQSRVTSVPDVNAADNNYNSPWSLQPLTYRRPEGFVEETGSAETSVETRVWKLCQERMKVAPAKRKVISLNEANEVAKKLAATEASRKTRRRSRDDEEEEEEDEDEDDKKDDGIRDEVSDWYGQSEDIW
jgi:hypothetical protein